ncbi:hypothetical protein X727_26140 [Mesorhizobium sp. L103C119B0]|nr:hypothetical protein X727_26140 [Mesorhizobium sp. L103C119B0]
MEFAVHRLWLVHLAPKAPWQMLTRPHKASPGAMALVLCALMGIVAKPSRAGRIDTALCECRLNPIAWATK